jgi:ParB family chromosome partitioning protein
MTDTTNAVDIAEVGNADEQKNIAQPLGTLEHLPPNDLVIGDNVRDKADLDKEFLASLREHGVLVPITARSLDDGQPLVRNGQRRVLGAREVGLTTVPVYVLPANASDEAAEAIERIVEQIVSNDQKRDLTDAQRARGIQQILDAGLSATKVAKRLSVSRAVVKAASTAAASTTAMEALNSGQLSLVEAAAIAEFEDDGAALQRLVDAAGSPRFDHTVAQLREERAAQQAYADAAATSPAQGYTVLDQCPHWRDTSRVGLRYLRTAAGAEATDEAVTNPAHWAVFLTEDTVYVDAQTAEPVDEDDIDFHSRFRPDEQPEDGLHVNSVLEKTVFVPEWYLREPRGGGADGGGYRHQLPADQRRAGHDRQR